LRGRTSGAGKARIREQEVSRQVRFKFAHDFLPMWCTEQKTAAWHCTMEFFKEVKMSYLKRDTLGMYSNKTNKGPGPELMGADTLIGDHVHNLKDEHLGDIKEIMLDMRTGRVAYAVLARGGVFTIGEKLYAVPWEALTLDTANHRMTLNVDKERLENAPGFDPDDWPNMSNQEWATQIHTYYGSKLP
jgi:sporulation protein YlmC with PRC-barrel domain